MSNNRLKRESPALFEWCETPCSPLLVGLFLLGVQALVALDDPPSCPENSDDGKTDRNEDKTTTKDVERLLVGQEKVRGKPMRGGTEGIGNSEQSGFLVSWSGNELSRPRDLDVET